MRQKRVAVLILLFLFVISGYLAFLSASLQTAQIERVFSGYLICRSCAMASGIMSADGVNVMIHPEKHTVQCMKMPSCVSSGFGIMIQNKTGNYKFYPFDVKGSDLAYRNIICKTAKKDNLLAAVSGKIVNGQIQVDNMMEK